MHIIHIASELSSIAKVGGLGDVIHGLAKEQIRSGHQVDVVLPKYDILQYEGLVNLKIHIPDLWSFEDSFKYHNTVWSAEHDGIRLFLIEPHHNSYYFNRGQIYGCMNDIERFLYFNRASLEFLHQFHETPDIIHVHDWPTATIAPLIEHIYRPIGWKPGAVILSIHNIEHQGKTNPKLLTRIGLRGDDFRHEDTMQDPLEPNLINLLKGGIVYSDAIVTVSPSYAREIKTSEFGFGLENTIQQYEYKLHGVLNGIETDYWNPSNDIFLHKNYTTNATYVRKILDEKKENRRILFQKLSMNPSNKGPVIACITRLVKQKGPKLIQRAIHYTLERNGVFLLLGTACDRQTEKEFLAIKHHYRSNPNLYIGLEFNEKLAHLIYASSDAIIIPSLFEPCGLTQMIGMRYGTVPIGRKTGGLADTIFDQNAKLSYSKLHNGFLFEEPSEKEIDAVLARTFDCFNSPDTKWEKMVQNGLSIDLSWHRSAKAYEKIYHFTKSLRAKQKTSKRDSSISPSPEDLVI